MACKKAAIDAQESENYVMETMAGSEEYMAIMKKMYSSCHNWIFHIVTQAGIGHFTA